MSEDAIAAVTEEQLIDQVVNSVDPVEDPIITPTNDPRPARGWSIRRVVNRAAIGLMVLTGYNSFKDKPQNMSFDTPLEAFAKTVDAGAKKTAHQVGEVIGFTSEYVKEATAPTMKELMEGVDIGWKAGEEGGKTDLSGMNSAKIVGVVAGTFGGALEGAAELLDDANKKFTEHNKVRLTDGWFAKEFAKGMEGEASELKKLNHDVSQHINKEIAKNPKVQKFVADFKTGLALGDEVNPLIMLQDAPRRGGVVLGQAVSQMEAVLTLVDKECRVIQKEFFAGSKQGEEAAEALSAKATPATSQGGVKKVSALQ